MPTTLVSRLQAALTFVALAAPLTAQTPAPDAIFHSGKVLAVDAGFTVHEAFAVRGGRIVAVGRTTEMRALAQAQTAQHDLGGRMVLPGLIDSHVHAPAAAMFEFDHEIPSMETVQDVLNYIQARTRVVPEGKWIQTQQVFITRLKEERFPTRAELDAVAPKHPVSFRTGPDNMLNTLALAACGFDRNYVVKDGGPGYLEKDAQGEITGLARGMSRFIRTTAERKATDADHLRRLRELFADYNRIGITAVADRGAAPESMKRYQTLRDRGELTVRMAMSQTFPTVGSMESILGAIDQIAANPLRREDAWLRLIGTKVWLDGGMLTGSAYMLQPWGRSEKYGIRDDAYRGVLNIPPDRLLEMVRRVAKHGLQFTAHSVGDGAVTELVRAYEGVNREIPIHDLRMAITHSNFMTPETIKASARLGVVLDIQPIWLFLDTRTLVNQFGYDRLRYFQPLRTILAAGGKIGGGSDHMLKIGDMRAINPYNPFHAMWTTVTRSAKWYEGRLHPEEALTRREAIEFYTRNNAHLIFWEKEIGSLEPGKRADFIVVDRDLLTCPENDLKDTRVLQTWVEGRKVFQQ
ncbi:amidohydrolase [Horticoccus sp. 23ND18S-11]|uniref:amidohydrolase n=1 Tax=Horticoccus sp. 23ND18S-11 TaxID=3391832 RepID=UPI0039C91E18